MTKEAIFTAREETPSTILGHFGVPRTGELMKAYSPRNDTQKTIVCTALEEIFGLNFDGPLGIRDVSKTVATFNELLFESQGYTLAEESMAEIAQIATQTIEQKYLGKPEAQFKLVQSLREAVIDGGGKSSQFDFASAGEKVLDTLLDSFNLTGYANQYPESIAIAKSGMTLVLQQLAG